MYKLTTEETRKWLDRIERSRQWRQPWEDKWRRNINFLKGYIFGKDNNNEKIVVNLIYPMLRVIVPAIYARNPDIMFKARQTENADAAHSIQEVVKYYLEELEIKDEVKLNLHDLILCGHSWGMEGYDTEFVSKGDYEDDETSTEDSSWIDKFLGGLKGLLGQGESEKPDEPPTTEGKKYIFDDRIGKETPWYKRGSPFNFFVPAYSTRPTELPWIVQQLIIPTIDVKNNPKYENTKELAPSTTAAKILSGDSSTVENSDLDDDEGFSLIYEVWDARTNTKFCIADDYDEALTQPEPNVYSSFMDSKYPIHMIRGGEIIDEFYPMDDIDAWVPQLLELCEIRTQQSVHRKRGNRKYAVTDDVDSKDVEDLKRGDDGTVVRSSGEDARAAVAVIQDAAIPGDVYAVEERIKRDITEIGGITGYQRGDTQAGAKTATEAAIVESQSRSRVDERLDAVGTFVGRIARNLAQITLKFLSVDQVAEVIGKEASLDWPTNLTDLQIRREFLCETIFGSSTRVTPEVERAQWERLYGIMAQDPIIDDVWLRVELLRVYGVKQPETRLNPEIAAQLKQRKMEAASTPGLIDAYGNPIKSGGGGVPGSTNGTNISSGVSSPADIRGGIRRPGGQGGGSLIRV